VANWEVLALCEDYQTKGFDTKGKTFYEFFKRLLYYWDIQEDIPTSSKKDAIFGHSE